MSTVVSVVEYEVWGLLGALLALVTFRILTGAIHTHGLFNDKSTGEFSPERVQLMVFTLVAAGYFLTGFGEMRETHRLAVDSKEVILLFGGSHGVYLFRKYRQPPPGLSKQIRED